MGATAIACLDSPNAVVPRSPTEKACAPDPTPTINPLAAALHDPTVPTPVLEDGPDNGFTPAACRRALPNPVPDGPEPAWTVFPVHHPLVHPILALDSQEHPVRTVCPVAHTLLVLRIPVLEEPEPAWTVSHEHHLPAHPTRVLEGREPAPTVCPIPIMPHRRQEVLPQAQWRSTGNSQIQLPKINNPGFCLLPSSR